tara:strand:+ start:6963 stop:7397 length:435 start_codon:yes stop_codon:yes gene_type:complete
MKVTLGKPGRKNSANTVVIDNFDTWNVDYTLARIIHPLLVKYRENMHGFPELWEEGMVTAHTYDRQLHFDFIDEDVERDYLLKKWETIVDKMCRAFGMIVEKERWEDTWMDLSFHEYKVEEEKYYEAVDEGLALFAKHYHSLWD